MAYKTIEQQQNEIIGAFHTLSNNKSDMLDYLIDLGNMLPPMDATYKTDDHLISGCMSKVWLVDSIVDNRLLLQADSNTVVTKGLIALLIKVFSGQVVQDIVEADLYFIKVVGIQDLIGFQRSNGFAYMVKEVKLRGLAAMSLSKCPIS